MNGWRAGKFPRASTVSQPHRENQARLARAGAGYVLEGIKARFLREGHPRDLTAIHPMMLGSKRGSGINRLAYDGLLRRVIGGSFSIFSDKVKEFVPQVEQIMLSGRAALEKGQEILVSSLV